MTIQELSSSLVTIQGLSSNLLAAHSPRLAKCSLTEISSEMTPGETIRPLSGEPLRKAHFVILSAAKNPAIFGFMILFSGFFTPQTPFRMTEHERDGPLPTPLLVQGEVA